MRNFATAVVTLAVLAGSAAGPVSAQMGESKTPMQIIEEGRQKEREQVERQYERARRNRVETPATSGKHDPWAGARAAEPATRAPEPKAGRKGAKNAAARGAKAGAPLPLR